MNNRSDFPNRKKFIISKPKALTMCVTLCVQVENLSVCKSPENLA